jgi:hypothetical protein
MKKSIVIGVAVLLGLGCVSVAGAHAPVGELFFLCQFPDELVPKIDGNLTDWNIVPENPYVLRYDKMYDPAQFQLAGRGELDISDYNPVHILGWNDNFNKIYFANQIYDNIHNSDRENPAYHWNDDNWEVEVNPTHLAADQQNLADEPVNRVAYKWAVPPVEGVYQSIEPIGNLTWLSDGTEYVSYGWSFEGEMFGASTYFYELSITPIATLARENATPENTEFFDLEENGIVHISIFNGDIDVADDYQGFWGTTPESSNIALNDFVCAELDPNLGAAVGSIGTVVEGASWGQIKAGLK